LEGNLKIKHLLLKDYKAFGGLHEIELRPLTVLIGRNSSGKSALARSALLLCHALSDKANAPLDLNANGVVLAGAFRDFIHGRSQHGRVGIGAKIISSNSPSDVSFWSEIQHIDEFKLQVVSVFEIESSDGAKFRFTWSEDSSELFSELRTYTLEYRETSTKVRMSFRGLIPDEVEGIPETIKSSFEGLVKSISLREGEATHLGPFREAPRRSYSFTGVMSRDIGGGTGELAPNILGTDSMADAGVLSFVGDWFQEHLGGWQLKVEPIGDAFSLVLHHPEKSTSTNVNIVDVGQGMSQVLPLVVQRCLDTVFDSHSLVEVIEQPELHLHPAAHAAVADLYVDALKNSSTSFIIETHSENFILRLRRRVAEGKLDRSKLIIYWVDDSQADLQLVPITVNAKGEVSDWPVGVFSEDLAELNAILNPE